MLQKEKYQFFVLEPEKGVALQNAELPLKSAFIFGHEEFGFSFDKKDYPDITLQNREIVNYKIHSRWHRVPELTFSRGWERRIYLLPS